MEEEWKEMAKSHVCMDGNGFWQAQKRYNLHKAYIGHMVLEVSQFCIALQVQVHSQMQRDKSANHFHDEFLRIQWILRTNLSKAQESIHELNMKERAFQNHICLKVKTPNINLSLLSIHFGLLYQKLCSPFFLLED